MNPRASADMWWIIIGAVIALVVMIVLMVIFTGRSNTLNQGLLNCESKGGKCLDLVDCEQQKGSVSETFDCSQSRSNPVGVCCFTGTTPVPN